MRYDASPLTFLSSWNSCHEVSRTIVITIATSFCGVAPRVDAQASSTRTGSGGRFPHLWKNGGTDRWKSPWFSLEITREAFPWVYERGNKPALLISTLEALAVLVSLKLLHGDDPGPTFTDNKGNGSALNKLMSTRFPPPALRQSQQGGGHTRQRCHCRFQPRKQRIP